jgi:hypothetical protein
LVCWRVDAWIQKLDWVRSQFLQFQFWGAGGERNSVLHFEFLFELVVKCQLVVFLEEIDDLIGIDVFFFEFLMVGAALESITSPDVGGHGFVELVDSE